VDVEEADFEEADFEMWSPKPLQNRITRPLEKAKQKKTEI